MFPSASEQAWRFNSEVAHFLRTTIEHAGRIRCLLFLLFLFDLLLLSLGEALDSRLLGLDVVGHRSEVALVHRLDHDTVALVDIMRGETI